MNRVLLSLVLLSLAPTAVAQAAEVEQSAEVSTEAPSDRDNLLFLDLSLGVVTAGYEQLFDDRFGVSLALGIYGPWYVDSPVSIVGYTGELRGHWYPIGTEPTVHPYVSPGFRLGGVGADDGDQRLSGIAYSPRLTAGAGFRFGRFFFRVGGGVQHHNVDLDERASGESADFSGFYPAIDLYVGAAF